MRRLILLAVLLGFLCLPVLAATYYIATAAGGGDNSHNGLYPTDEGGSNGPWLTLTYANSHVTAGDTVQIRGGTYQESTNWSHNGTADNRITITNYNGEAVVIDGGYTLPGGSVYYFLVTVSGDYVTLSNITIKRSSGSLLAISGDYSYAINMIGNGANTSGFVAMGDHNLFDGCTMTLCGIGYPSPAPTWGSAICTNSSNCTIQNCIAYENVGEGFNAYSSSSNVIIQDCISYDNDSYNIYLDSTTGGICRRNIVYLTNAALASSGIMVGSETGQPSNLDIYNNFVMGCWVNFDVYCTTLSGINVTYNTFVNSTGTVGEGYNMGVYYRSAINTYTNSTFKNNIVLEEVPARVPVYVESSHSGLTFSYNCWSETVIAAAQGTGDVVGDPKLAKTGPTTPGNLTANYFKILSDSPAIGKGIYDASILTDYFGTTRKTGTSPNGPDMGGYEYITGGGPPPIYYVDSSITDTYVGSATPDFTTYNHLTFETTGGSDWVYKTIADINACTFSPDDFIYFRRGQAWKERLLAPSSGTSGHPITIGAFGTGDAPQILGYCKWTTTGEWTLDSGNVWYAAITPTPTGGLTDMTAFFGGLRGIAETAKGNLNAAYEWWYDSGTPKRLYVYSTQNPYTAYGTIRCHIHQITINLNAKSYWKFVSLHVKGPIQYGTYDASGTTGIEFYYCLFDGMYGSTVAKTHTGLGSASGATNYTIANCDFIRWTNAITIAHTSGTTTVKNCRIYGFPNYGIYSTNTGIVTASYNHVMGWPPTGGTYNWTNNRAYYHVTDGGNNISNGAFPEVVNLGGYVPRFMICVDDMGSSGVDNHVHDTLAPVLDARSLKMTMPVVSGYLTGDEITLILHLKNVHGYEVASHSQSHQDWSKLNALTIQYVPAHACTMTISGNTLTTAAADTPGDNLNIDLTNISYDTLLELKNYIAAFGGGTKYTASVHADGGNKTYSKCLADVTTQDIKTSAYTAVHDLTRLVTSECADSKTALDAAFSQTTTSLVVPYGHDSSASWPIQQTYYTSSRCGAADMINTAENGINVQSLDGVSLAPIAGKTEDQIKTYAREVFVWATIWGRPQSLTAHSTEGITSTEYGYFFDALIALGATFETQSQIASWVKAGTNTLSTFWARVPTEGDVDWSHLPGDPTINAGTDLGLTEDYLGNPMVGTPDIGIYEYQTPAVGTYYVDSSAADDTGDGTIDDPFKTLAHAVTHATAPGDIVYLNRGGVWREQLTITTSGDATHQQVWTAYGSGDRPRIYGSDLLTTWIADTGHWKCTYSGTVQSVFFANASDGKTKFGTKQASKAACVAEYDWYSDGSSVWCYAATDPDTRYTSVEGAIRQYCIYETGKSYVTLDNIEVHYSYSEGITLYRGAGHDWNITNCTVQHIGLGYNISHGRGINIDTTYNTLVQYCTVFDCGTSGIVARAMSSSGEATNIIMEHNTVINCYHTALDWLGGSVTTHLTGECRYNFVNYDSDYDAAGFGADSQGVFASGSVGYPISSIKIHHNIILNNPSYAILIGDYVNGIEIYNNTCYGTRDNPSFSDGIATGTTTGTTVTGLKIKNNIASTFINYSLVIQLTSQVAECDNNCWYNPAGTAYVKIPTVYYHSDDFAQYKSDTGWDTHGKWEDPLFVSTVTPDFHLQATSPCINAGVNVGLTEDYEGYPIFGLPSIGAYEYPLGDEDDDSVILKVIKNVLKHTIKKTIKK